MSDPTKTKKPVDQKTLDMLAKGREARAAKLAGKTAAPDAAAPATPATPAADKPTTPAAKPPRCTSCWNRPCDKSGKRCAK